MNAGPTACDLLTLEQISLKVVEASPDAKIVIDGNGKVIIFNAQAELLFGRHRSEILDKSIELLIPEGLREKHVEHRERYFEQPRSREMGAGLMLRGLRRDGSEFPVQIKLAPIIIAGSGLFALAVVRRVEAK